jgi:hypothetical protein
VPTLFVRASEQFTGKDGNVEIAASWPHPHDIIDAPGNHFSMLEDHAETTARTVHFWLPLE